MTVTDKSGLPVILVTGGTSGLGLELVKLFLRKNYFVIATGRKHLKLEGKDDRVKFYRMDFNNLKECADCIKTICNDHKIDFIVNNAGTLSPPEFIRTTDGNEYTFQVNFLAHLLIDEIIIRTNGGRHPLCMASVTSMVYKLAKSDMKYCRNKECYSPIKAYSDSKFFLALMANYFATRYDGYDLLCFSLDPGIFGSSIYRMQKGWFKFLYRIAAPFMRSPANVAKVLGDILTGQAPVNGALYSIRKKIRTPGEIDSEAGAAFWEECRSLISPFVD